MQKISKLTLFSFVSLALLAGPGNLKAQPPITLESKVLALVDGSFINADRIEEIRRFQFKLKNLLMGDRQADGSLVGHYTYKKKNYSVQTLQELEKAGENSPELHSLLETAKTDFMKLSDEFSESGRGSKSFTLVLIEESCQKRDRADSILLTWAHTTPENENTVFKKEVTSFEKLETFLIDLFNFLTDLSNSCPKAQALFHDRVEKFKAIKILMPEALKKIKEPVDQTAFFAHLKVKHLDKLSLADITPQTVSKLVNAFAQNRA
jgi:hypothetical protein